MRPCSEPECLRPAVKQGCCNMHYMHLYRARQKLEQQHREEIEAAWRSLDSCDHLDCTETADLIFTWPQPIHRRERACYWHGRALISASLPGLTVEHLGEK